VKAGVAGRYTGSILTDLAAGAPRRSWLASARLHSSNASPFLRIGACACEYQNEMPSTLITVRVMGLEVARQYREDPHDEQ
jgi:hypothetical protein